MVQTHVSWNKVLWVDFRKELRKCCRQESREELLNVEVARKKLKIFFLMFPSLEQKACEWWTKKIPWKMENIFFEVGGVFYDQTLKSFVLLPLLAY
jgi:hypothetical protein